MKHYKNKENPRNFRGAPPPVQPPNPEVMSSSAGVGNLGKSQLPAPPGSENLGMSQVPAPLVTDKCGMCSLPVFRPTPFLCSKYVCNGHGVVRRLMLDNA